MAMSEVEIADSLIKEFEERRNSVASAHRELQETLLMRNTLIQIVREIDLERDLGDRDKKVDVAFRVGLTNWEFAVSMPLDDYVRAFEAIIIKPLEEEYRQIQCELHNLSVELKFIQLVLDRIRKFREGKKTE